MYRIFCKSYANFISSFDKDNYRLKISYPFELIVDINKYKKEKRKRSDDYKLLSDLIFYMNENVKRFPRLKAFLWTLNSRNIDGKKYGLARKEDLEEQTKLINSFLNLAYWY